MTDSNRLKRLLDAFALGYAEGRQGKPEIPAPEDDASAALAREEIPTATSFRGVIRETEKEVEKLRRNLGRPVVTTGPRDENGNPEWVNFTTEPDEFDPGAEAAAIPYSPVTAERMRRMRMRDAAREEYRAEEQRLHASTDPVDRLKVYMDRRIWTDVEYQEPHIADDAVEDVLTWLREERVLAKVWDEGFETGVDYLSRCCGCGGDGQEKPANPHEPTEAPGVEIRPVMEAGQWTGRVINVYRGL